MQQLVLWPLLQPHYWILKDGLARSSRGTTSISRQMMNVSILEEMIFRWFSLSILATSIVLTRENRSFLWMTRKPCCCVRIPQWIMNAKNTRFIFAEHHTRTRNFLTAFKIALSEKILIFSNKILICVGQLVHCGVHVYGYVFKYEHSRFLLLLYAPWSCSELEINPLAGCLIWLSLR